MSFTRAIVRAPSKSFASGLTTSSLGKPHLGRAMSQHTAYVAALRKAGIEVLELPPEERFPDSTFVEDCAVVAGGTLIWTRPGAPSRTGEVDDLLLDLPLNWMPDHPASRRVETPGTVDGGDVCQVDHRFLIGISDRTNEVGARQLAELLELEGFDSETIDIRAIPSLLHLKSGLSYLGEGRAIAVAELANHPALRGLLIVTPPTAESYAANCVRLPGLGVLFPKGFPQAAEVLRGIGLDPVELDASEFRKMDGGLSCLSIRL